ncbi:MAG: hypothetical protein WCR31_11180 [Treponema sp.]
MYKTFQMTEDHFAGEYHKKIRFFIYNSSQLTEVEQFASGSNINVMIINSQAFNARGKDARRIYMKLDEFRSRRPIDIIAKTNSILIIDEPQSVEGVKTKERLEDFHAHFTLRYSATHCVLYNRIYRLDAMDAVEKNFAEALDTHEEVAVYVKLPESFYISTPVGHYNPDWAIAFKEGTVKHIYFVAETNGDMSTLELKGIEDVKIFCARKHFEALSTADVKYEVVDSYERLLAVVRE